MPIPETSTRETEWISVAPPTNLTVQISEPESHQGEDLQMEYNSDPLLNRITTAADGVPNPFLDLNLSGPFFESDIQDGLDWMFCDELEASYPSNTPMFGHSQQWNPSYSGQAEVMPSKWKPPLETSISLTQELRSSTSPLDQLSAPTAEGPQDPEDRWPMFWSAAPVSLASLPSLGLPDEKSSHLRYYNLPNVTLQHITIFKELLRAPLERGTWPDVSLSAFPRAWKLDHCIDRYFFHFDSWVPVLHRPTFDPGKEPVITIAVIAIGACFTQFEGAHAFSNCLMELSRRLLIYMAERDPRLIRTEYYVATQLLQSIHGFACGNKRFYELAERNRGCLVNNARCAELFNEYSVEILQDESAETRWNKWLRAERSRRVAWAVYAHDAASASMRDNRPFISLNEIKMDLPCPLASWEAETPQAWAALHPWSSESIPHSNSFKVSLNKLLHDPHKFATETKDNYQRYLMIMTLTRMMWSLKEATTQPGARFMTPYNSLIQGKRDLLDVVDHFSFSPKILSGSAPPDHFSACMQQLTLIKLAQILMGDDAWDYLHLIWRPHPKTRSARDYILNWIRENPRTFRAFTLANAQLLTIVRLYPENHPQEAYNVFHAGMALWAMSRLFPTIQDGFATTVWTPRSQSRPVCNLDWLGSGDSSEANVLRDWVEDGGRTHIVRMHGVPDLFAPEGAQQVLQQIIGVLNRMAVWGIGRVFMNATLRVLHSVE